MKTFAKNALLVQPGSALFIAFWVVGEAENVVDRHIVVKGKFDKNVGGDVAIAQLVIAVGSLCAR